MERQIRNLDNLKTLREGEVVEMIETDVFGNKKDKFDAVCIRNDSLGIHFTGRSPIEKLFQDILLFPRFADEAITPDGSIRYNFFTAYTTTYMPLGEFRLKINQSIADARRTAA